MGLNLQVMLAASHGCSMEQEARDILRKAVQPQLSGVEFAQIAATALAHRMALATRNVKDFKGIEGLTVVNPWNDN